LYIAASDPTHCTLAALAKCCYIHRTKDGKLILDKHLIIVARSPTMLSNGARHEGARRPGASALSAVFSDASALSAVFSAIRLTVF